MKSSIALNTAYIICILLALSGAKVSAMDQNEKCYKQLFGFVPNHLLISGFTLDYSNERVRALNIEAEGDAAAVQHLSKLLNAFDKQKVDEEKIKGLASGIALSLKFDDGERSAEISVVGHDILVIETDSPPRAFLMKPHKDEDDFLQQLTNLVLLHFKDNKKIWRKVILKKVSEQDL